MEEIKEGGVRKSKSNVSMNSLGVLGKVPPQAREVEEAVLGALMLEKNAVVEIGDILQPECFYEPRHQEIYRAIIELFSAAEPIDILTVKSKLQKMGKLESAGGALYLAELTSKVNSAANITYHARIILEAYIKRAIIEAVSKILTKAYEDSTDVFNLLDEAEHAFFSISEKNIRKNYILMKDLVRKTVEEIERRALRKNGLTGVPSGFRELDRLTGGFQKSNLIIVAARPGMGKSAFMLSVARNAAMEFGIPVAIFSLEMSATELVKRLISAETEIASDKIQKGQLSEEELKQLHMRINKLMETPIIIDDTPALSVLELRAKARRLKAQNNIQMIIVDYLQMMSGGEVGKGNREQEIAYISRSLKNLAKELDVPVIALAQLSRAVETRGGDKKPQLSDLRESGSIEQDADLVMFLYRPEYYGITQDENGMTTKELGEVIIAKHRNGSTNTSVKLRFINKFTKFTEWEETTDYTQTMETFLIASNFPTTTHIPTEFDIEPSLGSNVVKYGSKLNMRNHPPANEDTFEPPF